MKRCGLVNIRLDGEAGGVDMEAVKPKMEALRAQLALYDPDCIINMDETGLLFRCLPKRTVAFEQEAAGKQARGGKRMTAKDRVTLVITANATGTLKVPVAMIGKAKEPFCFRPPRGRASPLPYFSQTSAWMDANICQRWFDTVFVPAVKAFTSRRVVLLWDNCPGHKIINNDPRIDVLEFPPNVTSVYQPMDQGIIMAVKNHFKSEVLLRLIDAIDQWEAVRDVAKKTKRGHVGLGQGGSANLLDTAEIIHDVWTNKTPAETIINCFIKADCLDPRQTSVLKEKSAKWQRRKEKEGAAGGGEAGEEETKASERDTEVLEMDVEEEDEAQKDWAEEMDRIADQLGQLKIPSSVSSASNTSRLPELARDSFISQGESEHLNSLADAVKNYFTIEDDPEVEAAILAAELEALELPKEARQEDDSDEDNEDEHGHEQAAVISLLSYNEVTSLLAQISDFMASKRLEKTQADVDRVLASMLRERREIGSHSFRQRTLHDMGLTQAPTTWVAPAVQPTGPAAAQTAARERSRGGRATTSAAPAVTAAPAREAAAAAAASAPAEAAEAGAHACAAAGGGQDCFTPTKEEKSHFCRVCNVPVHSICCSQILGQEQTGRTCYQHRNAPE